MSQSLLLRIIEVFLGIVLLFFCLEIRGQQIVQGCVEAVNGEPLSFASIGVVGTSIGTIANKEGGFSLILADSQTKTTDSIRFSYVGYASTVKALKSLNNEPIVIRLLEETLLLKEIVILPRELLKNPKKIVASAIRNIAINNDNDEFILKGFYRHTNKEGHDYKRLLEAAITVRDNGYSSNTPVLFNVDEIRKSVDNRKGEYIPWMKEMLYGKTPEGDGFVDQQQSGTNAKVDFKELKNLTKKGRNEIKVATAADLQYWESKHNWHSLYYFYYGNYARSRVVTEARKSTFYGELNADFLKQHKFKLDTITSYEDDLVYVVKILPSTRSEPYMYYEKGIIPVGKLYIRAFDMAVLKMEYSYIINPRKKGKFIYKYHFDKHITSIMFKTTAIYQEFQGKMYLAYLHKYEYDKVAYSFGKWKKDVKNRYFFMEREFMVNEIITDPDRIKEEVSSKSWDENLYTNKKPYSEEFWKNYTILKETPIQEKLRKDLEQEISLEKQFQESSN